MLERKRQVLRKRLARGVAWLHPFWRLPGRIRFLAFSSLYQLPTSLGSWHLLHRRAGSSPALHLSAHSCHTARHWTAYCRDRLLLFRDSQWHCPLQPRDNPRHPPHVTVLNQVAEPFTG